MTKFNIGDKVTFTNECRTGWWFGPHTGYKTGVISEVDRGDRYDYAVTIARNGFPAKGYVSAEHIKLTLPEVGDRVVYARPKPYCFYKQETGTVLTIDGRFAEVKMDRNGYTIVVDRDRLDVLSAPKVLGDDRPAVPAKTSTEGGEFILILKERGKFKPAFEPRVYTTEAQAIAVGKSMSTRNPGCQFVVFKALCDVSAPPPVDPTATVVYR